MTKRINFTGTDRRERGNSGKELEKNNGREKDGTKFRGGTGLVETSVHLIKRKGQQRDAGWLSGKQGGT